MYCSRLYLVFTVWSIKINSKGFIFQFLFLVFYWMDGVEEIKPTSLKHTISRSVDRIKTLFKHHVSVIESMNVIQYCDWITMPEIVLGFRMLNWNFLLTGIFSGYLLKLRIMQSCLLCMTFVSQWHSAYEY